MVSTFRCWGDTLTVSRRRTISILCPLVDIVRNATVDRAEALAGQRVIQMLLQRQEKTLSAFQQFLSENQLSSHCWVWAGKPDAKHF